MIHTSTNNNIYFRFSSKSEAKASDLRENLKEMFLRYYMQNLAHSNL